MAERCTADGCKRCGKRHNTLLHDDSRVQGCSNKLDQPQGESSTRDSTPKTVVETDDISQARHAAMATTRKNGSQVLLATASVKIYDRFGREHLCRAFLDAGSQVNTVRRVLCKRLQLIEQEGDGCLSGVGCGRADTTGAVNAVIHSTNGEFKVKLRFAVMERITEQTPLQRVDASTLDIPRNIRLADRGFGESGEVDLLLGRDIFWDLLCVGQIRLGRHLPILQKTKRGWIVAGKAPVPCNRTRQVNTALCTAIEEPGLHQQMERFWSVEEGWRHSGLSEKEKQCEELFRNTHKRAADGRFILSLPFREDPSQLGESREIALRRLHSVLRRLSRDPSLKERYAECLQDYLKSGHMTRAEEATMAEDNPVHYLPHHGVVKDTSTTTKLRIVFDASCRTSSGKSLNDILEVGPTIQSELFEIVLRFRQHRYVLTGDIERMYRQIWIAPEQRSLQRILWKSDTESPVEEFTLNTVTFGVASAPFLAVRCLHQLALETEDSEVSKVIRRDFYADDLITGANDAHELRQIKEGVSKTLLAGGFPMHKWRSNLAEIDEESDQAKESRKKPLGDQVKTLGLYWNVAADSFTYNNRVTKRIVLSVISQIYDPLGLVNPVIVQAKIMLQRLWQCKVGWDESLPADLHTAWTGYHRQLSKLEGLDIPRQIVPVAPTKIEVHGFCDASEKAYGACLYLRSIDGEGRRQSHLICAKSRVAPIKSISVPRLELCGALQLAKLMKKVTDTLTLQIEEKHYWCDSTVVLAWIDGEPAQWKTFVANRVTEIQETSSGSQWHHVRSGDNPADMLSRGVSPERLADRKLWWRGPPWLEAEEVEYPPRQESQSEASERRLVAMNAHTRPELDVWNRYSSLKRLRRVIAYCRRFANNCRRREDRRSGWLTVEELEEATNVILIHHQSRHFHQEVSALRAGRPVSRESRLLPLDPFLDDKGLLRVGGRLRNASLPYNQKFPIILASRDRLTELIIREAHLRNLQAGPEALLYMLRERYWILAGRSAVRGVLRRCLVCYRFSCKNPRELMGDLPKHRVSPGRAFLNVGVDYGGPFNIKVTRNKTAKAYLCLFVCFATRAVHLELVSELSTAAFLNSLRRFIARRGKCANIYSDNGTNFVGANKELRDLQKLLQDEGHQQRTDAFLVKQFIQWHFVPPYAPHIGGLWEAGIKSAKTRLKKVLGKALLTIEEFYTLLTDVEACLNSRPLTPMSSDPSDLTALTPGHFIIGEPLNAIQQVDLEDVTTNRLTRYQLLIKLRQHFWSQWSREYLSQLQSRSKWRSAAAEQERIKRGDMVVLKDTQIPLKWKLGRLEEIHPDKQRRVRVVSIRTENGVVQRALPRICILPLSE